VGHSSKFRSQRGRGSSRRSTSWNVGPSQGGLPSITAGGAFLWDTGAQVALEGLTLVRIRGQMSIWLESVGTIGDGFFASAFGLCVISENAFGVGVTAIPSPITDVAWDGWLWHSFVGPIMGFSVTESENTGPVSQVRMDIDSKAMRKLKLSDVIVGVGEFSTEVGVTILQFGARTRALVKLP